MADTYWGIYKTAHSNSLQQRVTSAAVKEGIEGYEQWAYANRWVWGAAPGWAAAYESAEVSGVEDPGADPAVITDPMILAQVQAMNTP